MKQKNFLKIALYMLFAISTTFSLKAQTLTIGDLAIIGVSVDNEEFLLIALVDIPSGESVFFTDNEWNGSNAFNTSEGFYEWVTPSIKAGTTITLTTTSSSFGGTVTQRAGSFALGNSGDGVFIYQTTTNVYNTGTYTILGFAGEDSGDSGSLTGTGLTEGTNAVYLGGDNGIYTGVRTTNDKPGHLTNIYNSTNWTTSGTAQTFDTTNFAMASAGPGITLGAVSGNTSEDGTTATFTIVLNAQPTTDVVLNITSGDTGEVTLNEATLTFTNANWDTPQTITATGVDDTLQDGSIDVTISVSVNDINSDDAYDPVTDVTKIVTNEDDELPNLVINEFQADPDETNGDANGDGSVSTSEDEFIEIYNASGGELNIGEYTIEDATGLRHTFPKGTIIPTKGTIVVFGGGTPTNIPSLIQTASAGFLGLNNGGDTITIKDANGTTITSYTYASEGGNNISLARDPDFTGNFVTHDNVTGNGSVLFSPGRNNTSNTGFYKTWSGTTDNNWNTTTNWIDSSNPSGTSDNILIPTGITNYPTVSTAVTINSLNIASGGTLKATNTFTVSSATFNRNFSNGSQWYLISSPIVGETYDANWATSNSIPTSSLDTDNIGLSWYDNTSSDIDTDNEGSDTATGHWRYLQTDDSNNGTFGKSKGYGIIRSGSGLISFTGTGIYTSTQTTTITYGTSNPNNYNLVGNPFTSFLNLGSFFTSNNTANLIGGTVWFWNGSSYDAKMSGITEDTNFEIAPGQGFFIEAGTAATSSDNISFDISGTDHNSTETFQKSSNITSSIYLNVNDGINNRYAKIYYLDGTTKGFDNGFDGKLFGGVSHNFAIYSNLLNDNTGNKYQVQSLPNTGYENMVIPIGLISEANSEITFSAEVNNLPNGLKVQLEDRATGQFTNLNEANYTVVLNEKQDGSGRFFLHTSQKTLSVNSDILTTASIYKVNNQTLKINGLKTGNASIAIYNILGKQILNKNLQPTNSFEVALPNMSTGVYVVKLYTKEGQLSTKIMID